MIGNFGTPKLVKPDGALAKQRLKSKAIPVWAVCGNCLYLCSRTDHMSPHSPLDPTESFDSSTFL